MRDGVTIYTDIFRPTSAGRYPAILGWSPYGKEIGGQWLDDIPRRSGVPLDRVSELQRSRTRPGLLGVSGLCVLNPTRACLHVGRKHQLLGTPVCRGWLRLH